MPNPDQRVFLERLLRDRQTLRATVAENITELQSSLSRRQAYLANIDAELAKDHAALGDLK